jgi:adenine-specific DNA-methyltransferase
MGEVIPTRGWYRRVTRGSDQLQLTLAAVPGEDTAKALGAFYTDSQIAAFLVRWAVRSPRDTVLDPSFGGGVFLRSACNRLRSLGGDPLEQVFGVEVDGAVHSRTSEKLHGEFAVAAANLIHADFFATRMGQVNVVVGNPPFIRYQRFVGGERERALRRAAEAGVRLSRLSSSWAPFLVCSVAMLRPGGRLAMVVPMELVHAAYAMPVLRYLAEQFGRVTFLTFRKKLFPDLSEDTLLLLAEERGHGPARFAVRDLRHAGVLHELGEGSIRARDVDAQALCTGRERLVEYLLPRRARELYRALRQGQATRSLRTVADVGIGYVTGANEFFHLTPDQVVRWEIPPEFLQRAVIRGRELVGLRMTAGDWYRQGSCLLRIAPDAQLPVAVRRYLKAGEEAGVNQAYKCRSRSPWFSVPHVHLPEAFLTYMGGAAHRLVVNEVGAVAPNSLHVVRLRPDGGLSAYALAALWQTSLTRLSVEVEGHALGGGMLKLEPTEAESVALARAPAPSCGWQALVSDLDTLVRCGRGAEATDLADRALLQDGLGLAENDCALLRAAAEELRSRRYTRGAKA